MKRIVCRDPAEVSRRAADIFFSAVQDPVRKIRVVLSGGTTPGLLYSILSKDPFRSSIDWNRIDFFWGDERCVPPDHPESNYRMATDRLLSRVPVPQQNIYRIRAEENPEIAAQNYEDRIREAFHLEATAFPCFDMILLGMGEDGHTASLFPRSKALHAAGRIVAANYVPILNAWRITLTVETLNRAALVVFLITGKSKSAATRQVLSGTADPEEFPAAMIRPVSGNLIYLLDREAAGL